MKSAVIPVTAGILSVGVLIFFYLRKREKDKRKHQDVPSETVEELEFKVKNQQVPAIVGRNSVILKSIEDKTQTQIRFREIVNDVEFKICTIKGTPENVKNAKILIDVEIAKPFVVTEELFVPTLSCGKIEGYSGSVLLEICTKSSAKVWVDPSSRKQQPDTRRVLITGTEEQVKLAKQLIDEKLKEEPQTEEKLEFTPSPSPSRHASNSNITATDSPREILLPSPEKLKSTDGQLEVFVSAVHSPSRFWVQLVGPQSTELDFLADAMTEYYSSKENREIHEIREPYLGQIVAAMLLTDNKWYRAEIVAIQVNETMPQELLFDVYFLDYGDKQFVTKKNILELRADFLSLRFQAVECFLAHVQPTNGGSKIDEWDEKAVEKFEELVQPSQWKKLISKVVAYKERKDLVIQSRSKQRESSPIPGVELYDPDQSDDKSIALELVRMGFADMNDEQFGDLKKSLILNPIKSDENVKIVEDVKVEENVKIVEDEVKVEENTENAVQDDIKVPKKDEEVQQPEETNNNSITTNGTTKKNKKVFNDHEDNLFKPEKKVKKIKKKSEALGDFLSNEQQKSTETKKSKPMDWNEMLEDD